MSNTINRYRENERTFTIETAAHVTTFKTRGTAFRQKQSFKVGAGDFLTNIDVGISTTEVHTIPMNAVTKGMLLSAPHRFKIFHRYNEADEFSMLSVCEGLFTHVGPLMGQIQLVGDYTDPIRCTVVYA